MFYKFLSFLLLIYVALLVGYGLRRAGVLRDTWTTPMMKTLVMTVDPIILVFSLWTMQAARFGALFLIPVAALVVCLGTMGVGRVFSGFHRHNRAQRGAYVACAMFSNNGITLGGFLCLLLLGKQGLGLGVLYALHFAPAFFTIGMLVGQRYSGDGKHSIGQLAKEYFTNPISVMPNGAILIGLLLKGFGVTPPRADYRFRLPHGNFRMP